MKSTSAQLTKIALVIVLIVGVFFRLYNLTHKSFWLDEAKTATSIAGIDYIKQDFFPAGKLMQAGEVLASFQQLNPQHNLFDMMDALAHQPTQHAPLFYVLLYGWLSICGSSVLTMRLLPALISILQMPATYWFCMELWGVPTVAALAMAMMALSPLEIVYAQQAREYSLYVLATLLASASLLRALRLQTFKSWALYFASLILALNSSLLTFFSLIAHFAYILVREWAGAKKTLLRFSGAVLIALCTCLPWLVFYRQHLNVEAAIKASPHHMTHFQLFKAWCLNFSCNFFDVANYGSRPVQALIVIVILIEIYALVLVWLKSKRGGTFVLLMIATNVLPIIALDIIFPTQRSAQVRYQLPAMIAVVVCVAYALIATSIDKDDWRRKASLPLCAFLLISGLVSIAVNSQSTLWRTQTYKSHDLVKVANILNEDPDIPVLVSDSYDLLNQIQFLSLSHQLRPKTSLELLDRPEVPTLPEGTKHFYLYNASPDLKSYLLNSGRYKMNPVDNMKYLLRVDSK